MTTSECSLWISNLNDDLLSPSMSNNFKVMCTCSVSVISRAITLSAQSVPKEREEQ